MLKNFDTPFLDFEGNPVVEDGKEVLLRSLVINAIQQSSDTNSSSGEEKYARFKLIEKIMNVLGGEGTEVSAEDIVTIKKCVGSSTYTPLAVGRIFDLLEA